LIHPAQLTLTRKRGRSSSSILERRDRIAFSNGAADLDTAIEPRAIKQRRIDRPPQQLLEISARKIQTSADEHRLADLEAPADQVVERHAERREVAAVIGGRKLHLLARRRRITPRDRLQHFHFD